MGRLVGPRLIVLTVVAHLGISACVPPIASDFLDDPAADSGPEVDDPAPVDLPAVPDDATSSAGAGTFFAVIADSMGAVGLFQSSAATPSDLQTIVDGEINTDLALVRPSPGGSYVAYINVSNQLVVDEIDSTESYILAEHQADAVDMDEFVWFSNDIILFTANGLLKRGQMVGGAVTLSNVLGGTVCYHDIAINRHSATSTHAQIALTYISTASGSTFSTVYVAEYSDDGTTGEISVTGALVSHIDEFGVDFDPMLTWVKEDLLIWRTSEAVGSVLYCNVPMYLGSLDPNALGWVHVDFSATPTAIAVAPDLQTMYMYGRGRVVASIPMPEGPGTYDASVFFTDTIEFTVSRFAFAPSGKYFLVGNRSRLRCFSSDDVSLRYSWWEGTSFEDSLNAGESQLLDVWWLD